MAYSKGGRGRQAPYTTTHVRVPDPLKAEIDGMISQWRSLVDAGKMSPTEAVTEVYRLTGSAQLDFTEALAEAQQIMKRKKSASESMTRLLTAIYGVEVTKDILRRKD